MIKKIKNLKIKIATIVFTSIFTFTQINAMENNENPYPQTKNNIIIENENVAPFVAEIKNSLNKVDKKFDLKIHSVNNLKCLIDDFKNLIDITKYQLKQLNDENNVDLKAMQDIINILTNINSENKLENPNKKNYINNKNIIKVSEKDENILINFFESLKNFSEEKKQILDIELIKQNNSFNHKKFEITEEMVKHFKNYMERLKNYIDAKLDNSIENSSIKNKKTKQKDEKTTLSTYINTISDFNSTTEDYIDKAFEKLFISIGINKINSSTADKAYKYVLDQCGIKEDGTIDYDKLYFNVIKNDNTKFNDNSIMFGKNVIINNNLKNELKMFVTNIKKEILSNKDENKIIFNTKNNKIITKSLDDYLKTLTKEIECEKKNFDFLINQFYEQATCSEIEPYIQNIIRNFLKIYENLFLDYDNKLNIPQLKSSIFSKIAKDYEDQNIEIINISLSDVTLNKLENKLQNFKFEIENNLNELKKQIIDWYKLKKPDDALECYNYIFKLGSDIFYKKIQYDTTYTNQNEEKNFKSKNLKNLKTEYKNLLDMICLKENDTIDKEKLLENLKKFNIIDKNIKITEQFNNKILEKLTKNFKIYKQLFKTTLKEFDEKFNNNGNILNIFESIYEEHFKNSSQKNEILSPENENSKIKNLEKEYNNDYITNKKNRTILIEKTKENLKNLSQILNNPNTENKTSLNNLTEEELNMLTNLINKLENISTSQNLNYLYNNFSIIGNKIMKDFKIFKRNNDNEEEKNNNEIKNKNNKKEKKDIETKKKKKKKKKK